jgi:hypothetical protein
VGGAGGGTGAEAGYTLVPVLAQARDGDAATSFTPSAMLQRRRLHQCDRLNSIVRHVTTQ